jgi:phosphate-selective porin
MLLIGALCVQPVLAGDDDLPGQAGYHKGMSFKSDDGRHTVNMGARVQVRFTQEEPDDGDSKGSFDIRRAKFWLKGKIYQYWKYKVQMVISSNQAFDESDPLDPGPDFAELEDAYFQFTKKKIAQLWIGQGKIMYGRQSLTSSGKLQFADRVSGFADIEAARSQGIGLIGQTQNGKFEYNLGLYDDLDGQNKRANSDDHFAYTARVVFTPFGPVALDQVNFDRPETVKFAIGLKGLGDTTEDGAGMQTETESFGLETVFQLGGVGVQGEYFVVDEDPGVGATMEIDAWWVQAGYLFPNKKFEIAARLSSISPDVSGPSEDIDEKGLAFNYYINKHNFKIQTDFRRITDGGNPSRDTDEIRVQAQFIL